SPPSWRGCSSPRRSRSCGNRCANCGKRKRTKSWKQNRSGSRVRRAIDRLAFQSRFERAMLPVAEDRPIGEAKEIAAWILLPDRENDAGERFRSVRIALGIVSAEHHLERATVSGFQLRHARRVDRVKPGNFQ